MLHAELNVRKVILKKLRHVNFRIPFIKLLIEINGPDAKLEIVKIRRNLHNEVIRTHIPQQRDDASLVEFDKFLGDTFWIIIRVIHQRLCKDVARDAYDMLFNKRLSVHKVVDRVWGDNLLEFQSINTRCISLLDIKIIIDIVKPVYNADPEGMRIAKRTILYPVNVFVFHDPGITRRFQLRIDDLQPAVQVFLHMSRVKRCFPQSVFAMLVNYGYGFIKVH